MTERVEHGCWCQTGCRSECFTHYLLLDLLGFIFTISIHLYGLHRMLPKRKENIQRENGFLGSEVRMGRLVGDHRRGVRNHNNHWLQQRSTEKHPRTAHMPNLEAVVLLNTPLVDFITQNALCVVVKQGKGERPKFEE